MATPIHEHKAELRGPGATEVFGIRIPPRPESLLPIQPPDLESHPLPQEYAWTGLQEELNGALRKQVQAEGVSFMVKPVPRDIGGDLGLAAHPLSKVLRQSPVAIAQGIVEKLNAAEKPALVNSISAVNGFVNFELNRQEFSAIVLKQIENMQGEYGKQNLGNGETVVIDCSAPNVAKYMSVGHLRSTVIGESLARIYKSAGYTVIRDNHLGDWGTQFGMLGRAIELWGDEIDREMPNAEPVRKLYQLYVKIHEEVEREKEGLPEGELTSLEKEGREWFRRLEEEKDPQAQALLTQTTEQSLQEFKRIYDLLGSEYEYYLGESFYVPMLPNVVDTFMRRGLAHKDDQERITVNLPAEQGLNPLVILKSDGASLYSTRDLATLAARLGWFHPEKILYVVGGDQSYYLQQMFSAFNELARGETPDIEHVSFGMISLPEGEKMSTRRGKVIFLEDVISEAISRARQRILGVESGASEAEVAQAYARVRSEKDLDADQVEEVARQVGVGAVIYMDLGQSRSRNIEFDINQALSLDANSAPYIQYSHTRTMSILRKAEEAGIIVEMDAEPVFSDASEEDLMKHLAMFPETIARALKENEPSTLSLYMYRTADLFNKFYAVQPVLSEEDTAKQHTRLRVTAAAAQVIRNGLHLLGIEAPVVM